MRMTHRHAGLFECREMRVSLRDMIAFAGQEREERNSNEDKRVWKNRLHTSIDVFHSSNINTDIRIRSPSRLFQ